MKFGFYSNIYFHSAIRALKDHTRTTLFWMRRASNNYGEPFWFVMVFLLGSSDQMGAWTPAPP